MIKEHVYNHKLEISINGVCGKYELCWRLK